MRRQLRHLMLLLLLWAPQQLFASGVIEIHASDTSSHRHFAQRLQQSITAETIETNKTLHITIGIAALNQLLRSKQTSPILALLVTRDEFSRAHKDHPSHSLVSAIYREQPVQRLLNLTEIATPTIQSIAVPIQLDSPPPTPDSSLLTLYKTDNLHSVIRNLLPTVDALITHHNPKLYNAKNFKHLLLSSYRQQKPLICHTRAMVTAGCIMGTYSTPNQLIRESIDWITEYQQGAAIESILLPRYSSHFNVATNHKVARSLGYQPPNNALLLQQLMSLEEDEP